MEFIEHIYSIICHQNPERCLVYGGSKFILCARCAGIYVGFVIAIAYQLVWKYTGSRAFSGIGVFSKEKLTVLPGKVPVQGVLTLVFLLFFVMQPLQVFFEYYGYLSHSSNELRLLLGAMTGSGFAYFLLPIFSFFCIGHKQADFWIKNGADFACLMSVIALGTWLFAGSGKFLFDITLVITVIGLAGLFVMSNASVVFMVASWRERVHRRVLAAVLSIVVIGMIIGEYFFISNVTEWIRYLRRGI